MNGTDTEGWGPLRQAADVVRGQLKRPGDYHRGRAAGTAERLMGIKLGAVQKEVLGVWGEVRGKASGTLHSGVAAPARAAALYRQLLAAARELLVPLPGRAARELADWADPRATAFFFRSGPAPPPTSTSRRSPTSWPGRRGRTSPGRSTRPPTGC